MTLPNTRVRGEQRTPIFFGPPDRRLYGCFHSPPSGPPQQLAVVLCYPFGQEYIRSHRAFVQLATRLVGRGVPVLRFDYSGTGDSAGESTEAGVDRWLEDISTAVEEIRQRAAPRNVALVGLRLGAMMAAVHGARRGDLDALALWDPVYRGSEYLAELRRLHEQEVRYAYVTPNGDRRVDDAEEFLGFAMPPVLRDEIRALDLLELDGRPARRLLLVESEATPEGREFRDRILGRSVDVELLPLSERKVWLKEPLRGIVPHRLLDAIVSWLIRVHS